MYDGAPDSSMGVDISSSKDMLCWFECARWSMADPDSCLSGLRALSIESSRCGNSNDKFESDGRELRDGRPSDHCFALDPLRGLEKLKEGRR